MANTGNTVAIIEDDASVCRALSRFLQRAGFQTVAFSSAEVFLVSPVKDSCACLLVDVQLEGMSGPDLQRRLREAGNPLPVIFITAHDDPAAEAEAIQQGCAGYIRKTDPGETIVTALRKVLAAGSPEDP
jgi:FixJ family two-component response regulator